MKHVALLCDFAEERWPSMDLVGDMLLEHLNRAHNGVRATRIRPPMRAFTAGNTGRLLNRFVRYPLLAGGLRDFDVYHVVDHSYSQLVHCLPARRTVVTCHDTDTFRCLFHPDREPRPLWFRAMASAILSGLRKAAAIACVSAATRDQLLEYRVVPADKLTVIPNGIHPAFAPDPDPYWDREAAQLLGPAGNQIELLHVGSTIPRKRIDVLLRVVAECRRHVPVRLIRAGGAFTGPQLDLVRAFQLEPAVESLPFISTPLLAAIYRRAAVVLIPSDAEGFGLPLAEALACGTPVLASDIPALREVGSDAACYAPASFASADAVAGCVSPWTQTLLQLLAERENAPALWRARRAAAIDRAKSFSWLQHARELAALYSTLLSADQCDKNGQKDHCYRRSRLHRMQRGE